MPRPINSELINGVPIGRSRLQPESSMVVQCQTPPPPPPPATAGSLVVSPLFYVLRRYTDPDTGNWVEDVDPFGVPNVPYFATFNENGLTDPSAVEYKPVSGRVATTLSDLGIQNVDPESNYTIRLRIRGMVEVVRIHNMSPGDFGLAALPALYAPILYDPYGPITQKLFAHCDQPFDTCLGEQQFSGMWAWLYALRGHFIPLACEWVLDGGPYPYNGIHASAESFYVYHGHATYDAGVLNMLHYNRNNQAHVAYRLGGCKAVRAWVPVVPMFLNPAWAYSTYPADFMSQQSAGFNVYQLVVEDAAGSVKQVVALNVVPESPISQWFLAHVPNASRWGELNQYSMLGRGLLGAYDGLHDGGDAWPGIVNTSFPIAPIDFKITLTVKGDDRIFLWFTTTDTASAVVLPFVFRQTAEHLVEWRQEAAQDPDHPVAAYLSGATGEIAPDAFMSGGDGYTAMFEYLNKANYSAAAHDFLLNNINPRYVGETTARYMAMGTVPVFDVGVCRIIDAGPVVPRGETWGSNGFVQGDILSYRGVCQVLFIDSVELVS